MVAMMDSPMLIEAPINQAIIASPTIGAHNRFTKPQPKKPKPAQAKSSCKAEPELPATWGRFMLHYFPELPVRHGPIYLICP